MFVGRTTVARCVMMYELAHDPDVSPHFKFSTMDHDGAPIWSPYPGWRVIERFDDWLPAAEVERMTEWWNSSRPASLDGKKIRDQYHPDHNTNLSILDHYVHFHAELVAETYTIGQSFFPTEKTVRPIMAARPFLIYAAPGFLQALRDLGFRTYHDFWNEEYDRYEGVARWQLIKSVIKDLCVLDGANFQYLMDRVADVARYNRCVLAEIVLTDQVHLLQDLTK
jgi:hypothetical protein